MHNHCTQDGGRERMQYGEHIHVSHEIGVDLTLYMNTPFEGRESDFQIFIGRSVRSLYNSTLRSTVNRDITPFGMFMCLGARAEVASWLDSQTNVWPDVNILHQQRAL